MAIYRVLWDNIGIISIVLPRALDNALLEPLPSCNHAVSKSMFYTLSWNNKNSKVDINDPNPVAMVLHAMLFHGPCV